MARYRCPKCQEELTIPPGKAGGDIFCSNCGQRLHVPAKAIPVAVPAAAPGPTTLYVPEVLPADPESLPPGNKTVTTWLDRRRGLTWFLLVTWRQVLGVLLILFALTALASRGCADPEGGWREPPRERGRW
jgi:hypothetical protein